MSPLIIKAPLAGSNSAYLLKLWRISSKSLKKSRWSAATFKIMPTVGANDKKLFVYSQASVIIVPEWPTLVLPLIAGIIPPTKIVGSVFAWSKICEIIEVVVVFPWVPETPIATS